MASTITAFHTFVADTKARASQANTNFSNFRGDLVPITADTATASHRANNLGATDHYWNNLYGQIYNIGLTSTAITQLSALTAGGFQIFINSTTVGSLNTNGLTCFTETPMGITTTASRGQIAQSATTTTNLNGTTPVTSPSIVITTRGRPVWVGLIGVAGSSETPSQIREVQTSTAGDSIGVRVQFRRASTYIGLQIASCKTAATASTTGYPVGSFFTIDNVAAGSYTYTCEFSDLATTNTTTVYNYAITAYEMGGP